MDISKFERSDLRGWGGIMTLQFRNAMGDLMRMDSRQLAQADLGELKRRLATFEQLRDRANELGLTLTGHKID